MISYYSPHSHKKLTDTEVDRMGLLIEWTLIFCLLSAWEE